MNNYNEPDNPDCTTREDYRMAQLVANHLQIPLHVFDFTAQYEERIIDYIYTSYQQWITPNPDVFCNNLIKFDLFLNKAIELGCDYIATGHYARVIPYWDDKEILSDNTLYRWVDYNKDQSYFLARLSQYQLNHALFPLGNMYKHEVREIAHHIWLPNADRKDSQWLCFIGNIPMIEFLKRKLPIQQWPIIDQSWKQIGTHQWARFYTLGQRHQLFLPFRAYVTNIDVIRNTIIVGEKYDEKLISDSVFVTQRQWTWDSYKESDLQHCLIKVRYRQDPLISSQGKQLENGNIIFHTTEIRWVAPGQILVAYDTQDKVIGSGIIQKNLTNIDI